MFVQQLGFVAFPLPQLPSCLRKARTPNWYERHNILRGEIVTLSGHKVNNFFYSTGKKKLLAPNLFPISFPRWTKKTFRTTSMTIYFLCLKKEHIYLLVGCHMHKIAGSCFSMPNITSVLHMAA